MLPGFSMKEQVTEFSGRGVGTDVVKKTLKRLAEQYLLRVSLAREQALLLKFRYHLLLLRVWRFLLVNQSSQFNKHNSRIIQVEGKTAYP